jgi:hypothetical protein
LGVSSLDLGRFRVALLFWRGDLARAGGGRQATAPHFFLSRRKF